MSKHFIGIPKSTESLDGIYTFSNEKAFGKFHEKTHIDLLDSLKKSNKEVSVLYRAKSSESDEVLEIYPRFNGVNTFTSNITSVLPTTVYDNNNLQQAIKKAVKEELAKQLHDMKIRTPCLSLQWFVTKQLMLQEELTNILSGEDQNKPADEKKEEGPNPLEDEDIDQLYERIVKKRVTNTRKLEIKKVTQKNLLMIMGRDQIQEDITSVTEKPSTTNIRGNFLKKVDKNYIIKKSFKFEKVFNKKPAEIQKDSMDEYEDRFVQEFVGRTAETSEEDEDEVLKGYDSFD